MITHVPVLIVGAGISGLVCAHALRNNGIDAQIVESSPRPGGMIRTERRNGFLLELGPQSFTATPAIVELCRNLGIQDQLIEAPSQAPRFLLLNGQLKAAPLTPPAFFASPSSTSAPSGAFSATSWATAFRWIPTNPSPRLSAENSPPNFSTNWSAQ